MDKQPFDNLGKFKKAVDAAYDHIVITDIDAVVVYANKAACLTTGYDLDEIIGSTPRLWGGLMDKSFYKMLWKQIKDEKKPFVGELNNKRKDGTLYVAEIRIAPIFDDQGVLTNFIGIERDVTDRKESDKVKTEFITLASHQLRTPLSTLNWYTEILLGGELGPLNKEQKQYIGELFSATKRMIGIVNDLLNVSRIELGKILVQGQAVDIRDTVSGVLADCDKLVQDNELHIQTDFAPQSYQLFIDPQAIGIIVSNLVTNAIKYTPNKGKIVITTTKHDGYIELQISDSGYGIPELQQHKIFSKFFRADNIKQYATEGTGLGLYITKSFVDLIQGTIRFESTEGKGTTFFARIPISFDPKQFKVKKTKWVASDV